MRMPVRLVVTLLCLLLLTDGTRAALIRAQVDKDARPIRVLMVTATAGFYHTSIETAQQVVPQLGGETGELRVTLLPDLPSLGRLTAEMLAVHDVVFFANTTGELPLDETQKQALLAFVASGGGFVATHSAADTFYTWPEYGMLLGAYFRAHPWTQPVDIRIEDETHPLTQGLSEPGTAFRIFEEIYVFRSNPRDNPGTQVLLSLDPRSVGLAPDAGDFPLAWCSRYGAGRVFYTALGHFESTWLDPRFQQHLLLALRWAAGRLPAPCGGAE